MKGTVLFCEEKSVNQIAMHVKVSIIGASQVGKTSITARFGAGRFDETQVSTIGVSFLTKSIMVNNIEVEFEMWDTAGQERYKSVTQTYIRGSQVVFCVYDLSKRCSIQDAIECAESTEEILGDEAIIVLVGNKSDLSHTVPPEIENYSLKNNICHFECSAKMNIGIDELFYNIGQKLVSQSQVNRKTFLPVSLTSTISEALPCC